MAMGLPKVMAQQKDLYYWEKQQQAQRRTEFMERQRRNSNQTPAQREFWQKVEHDEKLNDEKEGRAHEAQKSAARQLKVTPSQCALAYEAVLAKAVKFSEIQPFFSQRYFTNYLSRANDLQPELALKKRAYIYDCKVRGDQIKPNGEAEVWLEGLDASGKKGISVSLTLIPENNYWRIDHYTAETGLTVIHIPVSKPF
jgi:hypothetical protein